MTIQRDAQRATVVGAGLGGLMMAIRLARRGYAVDVYERRSSVSLFYAGQRSFTVTLSKRGLTALDEIGLLQEALAFSVPIGGRMVHDSDGTKTYVPYGKDNCERLHAIRRSEMNALLYRAAQRYPNIRFYFDQGLVRMDKQAGQLWFQDQTQPNQPPVQTQSPLVIGGDGVFSTVRQQMQRGERADFHQEFLDWGYKEVFIPAQGMGRHAMQANALHIWPRGHCTFFAFPNTDGTFSGNFIAPFPFAEELKTAEDYSALLKRDFADLLAVAPAIPQHLAATPMSHFITMHTTQWYFAGNDTGVVLLGDAVHAFTPFWGEGMNSAYEDTAVLDACLAAQPNDLATAFAQYQAVRKPNTDLITELAKQNFIELRDTSRSLRLVARKQIDRKLYQLFPQKWLPLNVMISHRNMSYVDAVARYQKQQRIARRCGVGVLAAVLAVGLAAQRGTQSLAQSIGRKDAVSPKRTKKAQRRGIGDLAG